MKKRINKSIVLILLISIFVICFMYKFESKYTPLEIFFKDMVSSLYNRIPKVIKIDYKNTSLNLLIEEQNEIVELRNMLGLDSGGVYKLEHSLIISRNVDTYFNNIIINKGEDNGINSKMIAITKDGLVGIVDKVTKKTASIKLLTSNELNIAVSIGESEVKGILIGYDYKENKMIVELLHENKDVVKGDKVMTNGLGRVYPSGIMVGVVDEVDYKNNKTVLYISSKVDFDKLKYISIIKEEG